MGSAALFFDISPQDAVLADINGDLVETYHCVRDHALAVHRALLRLPLGRRCYYELRSQNPLELCPVKRAARFIHLNRYCFNGLYRTNKQGAFNVPYSGSRTGQLPTLSELRCAARILRRSMIVHADFEATIGGVRTGDFVYLDPPFAVSNRRVFHQYNPSSFGLHDLKRLSDTLVEIDRRNATFLVSYAVCREAIAAFLDWHVCRVSIDRDISGFTEHRRRAVELLVSNAPPGDD